MLYKKQSKKKKVPLHIYLLLPTIFLAQKIPSDEIEKGKPRAEKQGYFSRSFKGCQETKGQQEKTKKLYQA